MSLMELQSFETIQDYIKTEEPILKEALVLAGYSDHTTLRLSAARFAFEILVFKDRAKSDYLGMFEVAFGWVSDVFKNAEEASKQITPSIEYLTNGHERVVG